ncbi:MAG: sugar ABC transporter ATP-binding protein [Blautia wexlerae]
MGEILLRAENIDKHFGITHALDNVSFTFNKGEIHALIGENGSGKSTLTSCLTGIYQKDSGKFILEGKEITATNQVEANHQGVAIIVQEIGTLSGLTVAENIFLGNEDQFTKCGIKNTAAMNKKAQEYLDSYGFNYIDATKVIDDYNFEDRKLVEIVKSTYFNPKVLVVDETTTALGQKGREELFKVMHKVRDTGNCVIFISHDLEEVIEQSDNISVLRDGVKIGSITKEEATPDRLKALMVGREIGDSYYRTDYGEKVSDEVVLSAKNVTVKGQIENLNLDLHKGEILGIGGLSECGMHEVGKALFGASYFRQGSVTLGDGTPINSIPDAIKHSIAYASKDRDNESLVINDTIGDNICLPSLEDLKTHGFLRAKTMNEFANKFAKQMSTKMTGVDQFVSALSGGNKQKVVLARWVGKDSLSLGLFLCHISYIFLIFHFEITSCSVRKIEPCYTADKRAYPRYHFRNKYISAEYLYAVVYFFSTVPHRFFTPRRSLAYNAIIGYSYIKLNVPHCRYQACRLRPTAFTHSASSSALLKPFARFATLHPICNQADTKTACSAFMDDSWREDAVCRSVR